jgi:hypothetical protein
MCKNFEQKFPSKAKKIDLINIKKRETLVN